MILVGSAQNALKALDSNSVTIMLRKPTINPSDLNSIL